MPVFVTTRWSVVLAARDQDSPESAAALEALCHAYWLPLYGLVRRLGHAPHDAEDLTQEFFARLLAKDHLQAAAQERGRFRTFLRVALKRFLANEHARSHADKRGGGRVSLPIDTSVAETSLAASAADRHLAADVAFDRRWAFALLEDTLARLRTEYDAGGKAQEFSRLKAFLTAERGDIPYATIATDLKVSAEAARVAVHRLRKRFREVFRAAVADTVKDPSEVDTELRYVARLLTES